MKKILSMTMALLMIFSVFSTLAIPVSAGDSFATATSVSFNETYSGEITEQNSEDVYEFTLSESGRINIKLKAYIEKLYFYLYDADGNEIWKKYETWNTASETINGDWEFDLTKGTYYFAVEKYRGNCGNYTFSINCAHKWSRTVNKKATTSADGNGTKTCAVCKTQSTYTIPKIKSIKLSRTAYTYDGNTKKPTVTVKDSKGNKLVKDTDYTVKYSSGRKNIGQYTATVTFKGKYSGTKKLTFKIVPGKVTGVKQIDKKGINFKWNKVAGAGGYQVYRYNSSKGEYERLTTISGTNIGNSSAKGSMKVKVRAYKKVNNKTYYGAFSTPVTIKAKK